MSTDSPLTARAYCPDDKERWNSINKTARNGTFLLDRGFMEYHADRFEDASVVVEKSGKIVALFPANRSDDQVISHGGLTYGGLISGSKLSGKNTLAAFMAIANLYRSDGVRRLIYKPVPSIYHRAPAEEDSYALFRLGARLFRRDLSATIALDRRLPLSTGRKSHYKKARECGLTLEETKDYAPFMAMVAANLQRKYKTDPVHSAEEVALLNQRFPKHVRLFAAYYNGDIVAGALIFETDRVAHAQYISCNDQGRELDAQDFVVGALVDDVYSSKAYFDFGISTENGGHYLNEGLSHYKESWGARGTLYDAFDWDLSQPPSVSEPEG